MEYQLYFLMLAYRWQIGKFYTEPSDFANFAKLSADFLHRKMEKDKRLFQVRCSSKNPLSNSEINQLIAQSWQTIAELYGTQANTLLASVALVVVTEDLSKHPPLILTLQENKNQLSEIIFKPATLLFTVKDMEGITAAQLVSFHSQIKPSWQLDFSYENQVVLKPLTHGENDNHPVFVAYGLSWGDLPIEKRESLLPGLQKLLWHGASGKYALMYLFPNILMCQWQFSHIDAAAALMMEKLDRKNSFYRSFPEKNFRRSSMRQLQKELQAIKKIDVDTRYTLSRLKQAINTLEVNRSNLLVQMEDVVQKVANGRGWQVDWIGDTLAKKIKHQIDALTTRQIYLEGQLIHLGASESRWQVELEMKRVMATERLNRQGSIITLVVVMASISQIFGVTSLLSHEVKTDYWWKMSDTIINTGLNFFFTSPTIYLLVALFFIIWIMFKKTN